MHSQRRFRPTLEPLEDRATPAVISSQTTLKPPLLEANEVKALLIRANAATASNDAIIAIVDRGGNILGVRVESGVLASASSDQLFFAIDGAVAKARTAAFFANNTAPLTSRTIRFISQSTITQREVDANPSAVDPANPNLLELGPGFVAPIGLGGHFPPNVANTPQVDLFAIEHTNRDSYLLPGLDGIKGTPDDQALVYPGGVSSRFNINPAFVPAGQRIDAPLAYGETLLTPADQVNSAVNHYQARGIATLPGGIPLYQYGVLVGGIGVFFPGKDLAKFGYATQENSSLGAGFDPSKPDRTLEAEFIALAAAGGSSGAGFPVGALGGVPRLPGFDIPFGRIDLVGITVDVIGPGGIKGPANLVNFAKTNLGVGLGAAGGVDQPVDPNMTILYKLGRQVPQGWLVTPHAGLNLSAADVRKIINQGVTEANKVRAQIRLPNGSRTRMVFAVADSKGEVLGLYRMPDATVFSLDVAVAKARNTAYYNDPNLLQIVDKLPGIPAGAAFTNRTFRFAAEPFFPEGIDAAPPGPFSILNDPGIDPNTGLQIGPRRPITTYVSILGYDSFHPGTNFHAPTDGKNQNGVVFFPGSSGVYKTLAGKRILVGGFGVSGDGVDQDDVVTNSGIAGFAPPNNLRADQFFFAGVRLPYLKFPRNPRG